MKHEPQPLITSSLLIVAGGILVMAFTLVGVLDNPGDIIREDVRFGPMVAASKILGPFFLTIGIIYYLASIKKCQACGKIFFWRKKVPHQS